MWWDLQGMTSCSMIFLQSCTTRLSILQCRQIFSVWEADIGTNYQFELLAVYFNVAKHKESRFGFVHETSKSVPDHTRNGVIIQQLGSTPPGLNSTCLVIGFFKFCIFKFCMHWIVQKLIRLIELSVPRWQFVFAVHCHSKSKHF